MTNIAVKNCLLKSGCTAELGNGFIVFPRDPSSNLGVDRKFSYSVCAGNEIKSVVI
jgi:hypothetical protein